MKVFNEDTGEELRFDVEIKASKIEILNAIMMLSALVDKGALANEAIFTRTGPLQTVKVTKLE